LASRSRSRSSSHSVLAVFGPTATGKSELAHAAALALGGEILVCDPFQRYRGLEIASDAPSQRERDEVPYHMVGDLDLSQGSTAGEFAQLARDRIDDILRRGRTPIVAGGTGLYIRMAIADVEVPPPVDPDVRADVEALVDRDPAAAGEQLRQLDPTAANRVDLANPRRVARALEIARTKGGGGSDALWTAPLRHPTHLVGVTRPPAVVHERISTRVQRELVDGLVAEIRALRERADRHRAVDQIIGVREVAALDAGAITADELPGLLAQRTRQLARKQLTWLRKLPGLVPLDLGTTPTIDHLPAFLSGWREASL
jgi:tRNA dimethylallyltransferase